MSTIVDELPEIVFPHRCEVVNGEVVEAPPMSAFAAEVANRLRDALAYHGHATQQGRPRMAMLYRTPLPEDSTRNRAPDLAFSTFDRWPESRPMLTRSNPVDVVPNLMVEVASPTDDAEDMLAKVHEYLRAGAELVWLVFPLLRQIYAYTAITTAPRLFTEADTLDAGAVLPGFAVPLAGLFPIVADGPGPGAEV